MHQSRTRTRLLFVLASSGVLTGCPSKVSVSVQAGSTKDRLVFQVDGKPEELPHFIVESCASTFGGPSNVYWAFEPVSNPKAVRELKYGEVPSGYKTITAPRPLDQSRCYTVAYGGGDELYIWVESDGSLREVSQDNARRNVDP